MRLRILEIRVLIARRIRLRKGQGLFSLACPWTREVLSFVPLSADRDSQGSAGDEHSSSSA